MFLAQAAEGGGGLGGLGAFLPLIIIVAAFYFLLIRPQRQRQKRQAQLVEHLEVGDQVQTVGGLYGVIISLDEEAVVLGVDEGRIRVSRRAIANRMTDDDEDE